MRYKNQKERKARKVSQISHKNVNSDFFLVEVIITSEIDKLYDNTTLFGALI